MLTINKDTPAITGTIDLPASKSISNRLLIIKALSENVEIKNLSESDDTLLLSSLLQPIKKHTGTKEQVVIDCQNAGTVFRFLTALLSVTPGSWCLTGSKRMLARPVGPLVEALQAIGARIEYAGQQGFPPLNIEGRNLQGGHVKVDPASSSQFVSALILIGTSLTDGLKITLTSTPSSLPYIEMTLRILQYFDVDATIDKNQITIPCKTLKPRSYTVEADWSAASYWYLMAALSKSAEIYLPGLSLMSLQGDSVIVDIFSDWFGVKTDFSPAGMSLSNAGKVLKKFDFDFLSHPDIVPAVAVACAALEVEAHFSGIRNLRFKESDRIAALQKELSKVGIITNLVGDDILKIIPQGKLKHPASPFETYGDHRIAMALAPLAIPLKRISIQDPKVVSKSYPQFWTELQKVGFKLSTDAG